MRLYLFKMESNDYLPDLAVLSVGGMINVSAAVTIRQHERPVVFNYPISYRAIYIFKLGNYQPSTGRVIYHSRTRVNNLSRRFRRILIRKIPAVIAPETIIPYIGWSCRKCAPVFPCLHWHHERQQRYDGRSGHLYDCRSSAMCVPRLFPLVPETSRDICRCTPWTERIAIATPNRVIHFPSPGVM